MTLEQLIQKASEQSLSETERQTLQELIEETSREGTINSMSSAMLKTVDAQSMDRELADSMLTVILEDDKQKERGKVVHRIHFLKTAWFRYAAASILIILSILLIRVIISHTPQSQTEVVQNVPPSVTGADVLPGSDKAVLTLSDGKTVQLNNATSEIINDGTLSIKNSNGQLLYSEGSISPAGGGGEAGGGPRSGAAINTMSTPNGGQYKLTLADGTKVWLNAASSITYPTAFNEKTRQVKITGEAYFEVAKNAQKPFVVNINEESKVTVLGTSFNINSYPNEKATKTTLLEGKIIISKNQLTKTLSPGQEATIDEQITIDTSPNPEQAIAWKNGVFHFTNADLPTVMRQLERWYDIKVEFRGKNTQQFRFSGKLQRSLTLSQVLNVLEKLEVKFKIEGKNLIVNP